MTVLVAVAPRPVPGLDEAIRAAGADIVEPAAAEAIIWTSPAESDLLASLLEPRHRWVALVVAGVEHWIASGIVDSTRTAWRSTASRWCSRLPGGYTSARGRRRGGASRRSGCGARW